MSDTLPQRPIFSNGQYIGADDLNAAVAYARDESERQALSGRTWGIATGLALVEITDATGATQMYIEPGIAWDGYGRPVLVIAPAAVTADMFAGLPGGNQMVWLTYQAVDTQMIAPGFQTCGAGDPATRVAETYTIMTGSPSVTQQTAGIVINGVNVPDPRNMLIAVDTAAAVVLDGSAPHQLFPDDTAQWLIPVGIVSYVPGAAGGSASFNPRTPTQLALSRIARRYIGTVAESVLAADGVLRLRDRQTDQRTDASGNIVSNDSLAAQASIQLSDIEPDPNNATRLIGYELVWVEGNLRVVGDARLFGGELNFRASDGTEPLGSFFLRRNAGPTNTTQNLEVSIGQAPSGPGTVNRMLVAASQNGTLATPPALSVGTDSTVGIGVAVPETGLALDINGDFGHDGAATTVHLNGATVGGDNNGNLLLIPSGGTVELGADGVFTHVAIGTASPQADTALDVHGGGIAVNNTNAFLRLLGSAVIDQDDGILRIRSGGNTVAFDGNDNVGIGTTTPAKLLDVSGDANVFGTLTAGSITVGNLNAGNASLTGSLTLGGGISVTSTSAAFVTLLGSRLADNNDGVLHIQSGGSTVAFDGFDNVGIGTSTPQAMLHVTGNALIGNGLTVYGTFSNFSDIGLKQDIRPLDGALEKLLALRGAEFEWARDDLARLRPGRQVGLIADEVAKVFPQWVSIDPASGMKLLCTPGFEALVVEALRQLSNRVDTLEAENDRLSRTLAALATDDPASVPPAEKSAAQARRARS